MSFEEQERALFDLLFDHELRENFRNDSVNALLHYDLDENERADFTAIRPDALAIDAGMRANLVLSHLCRAFPIGISIISSFKKGLNILKALVDAETMRIAPPERAMTYGTRLRERLVECGFSSPQEQTMVTAILEAELGMAWTGATLKRVILEGNQPPPKPSPVNGDWTRKPIKLAAYVSAAVIPQPYTQLKRSFCPCTDAELWRYINSHGISASLRKRTLQHEDPRLLVTRAHASHISRCEPTIDQKTVELSEGFAPLFQHIDGSTDVEQILWELKQAGAPEQILQGVRSSFQQLLETGMLEFVDA